MRELYELRFAFVTGVVGLFLMVMGWSSMAEAFSSSYWPRTTATVTRGYLEEHGSSMAAAVVEYTYTANGQVYENDRLRVVNWGYSKRSAKRELRRYPVGSQHEVAYRADDPLTALLLPGPTWQALLLPGVAAICLVLCVFSIRILRERICCSWYPSWRT